jgi:microcompartment protein CcmK/EutM
MDFGIVKGNVVCTVKDRRLEGRKLLLVQPVSEDLEPYSTVQVAIDSVGAGAGELVLYVKGSSARMTDITKDHPVDCTIMAIVDYVEKEGKIVFRK